MLDKYVVGRIKQWATEGKINLQEEIKEYNTASKKAKLENKSLVTVVEEDLKEKVASAKKDK